MGGGGVQCWCGLVCPLPSPLLASLQGPFSKGHSCSFPLPSTVWPFLGLVFAPHSLQCWAPSHLLPGSPLKSKSSHGHPFLSQMFLMSLNFLSHVIFSPPHPCLRRKMLFQESILKWLSCTCLCLCLSRGLSLFSPLPAWAVISCYPMRVSWLIVPVLSCLAKHISFFWLENYLGDSFLSEDQLDWRASFCFCPKQDTCSLDSGSKAWGQLSAQCHESESGFLLPQRVWPQRKHCRRSKWGGRDVAWSIHAFSQP